MISNNNYFSNFKSFENYLKSLNFDYFNIVSVNIRSISSVDKFMKFKTLISKFKVLPNIIAIQETWFQSCVSQIYSIPGYSSIHCCRNDGYGGTSLYIRDNLQYLVEFCESKHFVDSIRISIENFKVNGRPLKLTTFYRSQKCDLSVFLCFMEDLLCNITRFPSIIVGDSNIDFHNVLDRTDLSNILCHYDYRNCHTMTTRPTSGTSIDHVYSNTQCELLIDSVECDLTDHNIISCKVRSNSTSPKYKTKVYQHVNYEHLRENLQQQLRVMNTTNEPSRDMSSLLSNFIDCIKKATITKEESKLARDLITPWVSENLNSLKKFKEILLKQRKRGDKPGIEKRLKRISKIIKLANRIFMNDYFQSNLEATQGNPKKTWYFLNETLGRGVRSEIQLKHENGCILNDKEKCDAFNKYFLEIPRTLKSKIVHHPGDHINKLNSLRQSAQSFSFNHTSVAEVEEIITSLNLNKCPGHDGITVKALRKCLDMVSPLLTQILNNIIDTAEYPEDLKICRISPIPKDANAHTVDNFRPIALLPIMDKVFERILYKQLMTFLEHSNQLYMLQFGFRKGSSTQEAVVNVINLICDRLDEGYGGVAGIFYDLSKAFDLVDHNVLIEKLSYYGIRGRALQLIKSYLEDRKQYVQINVSKSEVGFVEHGVPQGSVLGPLLFTVFINDISNLNLYGKPIMYADDITILYPYNHEAILRAQMEHDSELVLEYTRLNKLVLNANKTHLLRFRPYTVDNNFKISIGGREIIESSNLKYLGINFQNNLSWSMHIRYVKGKVAPALGILYKFKNKFDVKTKQLLYNTLIHSHFSYLPIIYANKTTSELKSLQRTQNKAIKLVFNLPITFSTYYLYKEVSKTILPIYGLYKFQLLMYMFKSLNNIGYHVIEFRRNQNAFNTRNCYNLYVKKCRLETTKQRIEYAGCSAYNHLPQSLKSILRIATFKTSLKNYLIENIEMLL